MPHLYMNKFILFLIFNYLLTHNSFALINEILVVYDDEIITTNDYVLAKEKDKNLANFDDTIDSIILERFILKFAEQNSIKPSIELIDKNIVLLAEENKIELEQLIKSEKYGQIRKKITQQITLLMTKRNILDSFSGINISDKDKLNNWLKEQLKGSYFEIIKKIQ